MPELFEKPGRILYVGACTRHFTGARELIDAGNELTVMEVWAPFLMALKRSEYAPLISFAVVADVRTFDANALLHGHYDYAIFCHGPEHLPAQDVRGAFEQLEAITDVVLLVTPDGWMPNPANSGNPYTEHLSAWHVSDFLAWDGWDAVTDGEDITAWWRRESSPQGE